MGRVRQPLRDPDAEQIPGLEIGVVQRVDVGAQLSADRASQRMAIRDGGECVELRLERRDPLRLDGGFVHEARVEIADLAAVLARRQRRPSPHS